MRPHWDAEFHSREAINPFPLTHLLRFLTLVFAIFLSACTIVNSGPNSIDRTEDPKAVVSPVVPTVIVDGIWGWHSRWDRLRQNIETEVGPCQIWRYDSSGRLSLEMLGARLAADLRVLNGPFNAVGYSMGGLIIREAMRQEPDLPLQRVAFLNCPHRGSLVAHLLPLAGGRDMRPGSPFLRRLNAAPWDHPTLVTWCPGDLMVLPGWSARWSRATRTIRTDIPAHDWPVVSGSIHRQVILFLNTQ